jgi:hypothetical protein
LLPVFWVSEEADVSFPGACERGNLPDKYGTVTPQLSAKMGNDFL